MTAKLLPKDGVISALEVYTLDAARYRLGLKGEALRRAFRAGLRFRRMGNRKYVLGEDIIEYLKNQECLH